MNVTTQHIASQSDDAARVTDLCTAHVIESKINGSLRQSFNSTSGDCFIVGVDAGHADDFGVVPVRPYRSRYSASARSALSDSPFRGVWVVGGDLVDVLPDGARIVAFLLQGLDRLPIFEQYFVFLADDRGGVSELFL